MSHLVILFFQMVLQYNGSCFNKHIQGFILETIPLISILSKVLFVLDVDENRIHFQNWLAYESSDTIFKTYRVFSSVMRKDNIFHFIKVQPLDCQRNSMKACLKWILFSFFFCAQGGKGYTMNNSFHLIYTYNFLGILQTFYTKFSNF